jgi:hypothetical protein
MTRNSFWNRPRTRASALVAAAACAAASAAVVATTLEDFHLPGTQVGDIPAWVFQDSSSCRTCHGDYAPDASDPYQSWAGSLMAQAGRDPLFLAQMSTANQDVQDVGYFCLRCHVPMSFPTGHAYQSDGSTLDALDKDGVNCHFCHSMVDPRYAPGASPPQDRQILGQMAEVPGHYANAMFALHEMTYSPFFRSGDMCGTCHDVGNVATQRQPDGTYRYNQLGQGPRTDDPHQMFPLERTYTEWKLSTFANGGVDMGGRFGGTGVTVVSNCQDCHMPRTAGKAASMGPDRPDLARHDFAGAAAPVLRMIAEAEQTNPAVDQLALQRGIASAEDMLRRAATLTLQQQGGGLRVRVTNESGHKLPTGHIEGRRVFLSVRFYGAQDVLLREYGHYDLEHADLDGPSTRVYEMVVGLSDAAALATGFPAGPTGHMSLADTIVKDNRIPPRGFQHASYAAGGAPVVGAPYADGQHWDDAWYQIPPGAVRVEAELAYQCLPREYVVHLREANQTDGRGAILMRLWERTGRGAPIRMALINASLQSFLFGDVDGDCRVGRSDGLAILAAWGSDWTQPGFVPRADLDGDHRIGREDWGLFVPRFGQHCP